ncbi:hypothetical protein ACFQ09_02725 [Massilia norwichensis]|uniref:Sel1 repeat family protein n=1 Tax=Massilia norwichensis TaxID=1442366 RepID=A0ABT2A4Q0_9BURK|nr:hypothetical protein [Massilia norwichensis]MCS0589171.1 hypothetical protein [Massilia norwichensis]
MHRTVLSLLFAAILFRDLDVALRWYTKAAQQGNVFAKDHLRLMFTPR